MARQKEPVALVELKGKNHLTKAEKEKRRNEEIQAPSDKITPPVFLNRKQKKRFEEIARQLVEVGIIANLDAPALARYVVSEEQYEKLTRIIDRNLVCDNALDEPATLAKLLNAQDKLFKQCRAAASDLGMTITSRCRIVIPKAEEKPENRFAKFGKEDASAG